MDQNAWIMLLVGIAVASSLFALGVVLYPKLKTEKQAYPLEAEIEAALLPIMFAAIDGAYKVSERCVDDIHQRLKGADKKKIADKVYALLPDTVGRFSLVVVKQAVTKDRFEQLVQNAFDQSDRFFTEHKTYFDEQFEKWKATSITTDAPAQPMVAGGNDS